jgi:hypothetical protein
MPETVQLCLSNAAAFDRQAAETRDQGLEQHFQKIADGWRDLAERTHKVQQLMAARDSAVT